MPVTRKHDVTINGLGYMLARTKGYRSWQRTAVTDLPEGRQAVDAQYGQMPAEYEVATAWNDWSGGMGEDVRKTRDNTYNWSEGMDARFPGQLTHAQKWCQFSSSGTENRMRYLTQFSGGSYVEWIGAVPSADETRYNAGYSDVIAVTHRGLARIAPRKEATDPYVPYGYWGQFEQSCSTLPAGNLVPGKPALWGKSLLVPYVPGFADATGGYITGLSWEASGVGLNLLYSGNINDVWPFDYSLAKTGGTALPSYLINRMVFHLSVAGNRIWSAEATAGTDWGYRPFSAILRNAAKADNTASLLDVTNWSTPYQVGRSLNPWVQDMLAVEDQVYVAMQDGLYAGDTSGTFRNVLPELESNGNYDNLRNICLHQGQVIAPTVQGLFAVDANGDVASAREISPPRTKSSPFNGFVRTVQSYGRWLYAGFVSGTASYLLAGQNTDQGFTWHPLYRKPDTTARIGKMFVDGITMAEDGPTSPRMWITTDDHRYRVIDGIRIPAGQYHEAPLYVCQMPLLDDNPLTPALGFTGNYVGSALMELPMIDGGAPETNKVWRSVAVAAENMQSGTTWAVVQYLTHATTGWQTLGTINTSPYAMLHFTGADAGDGTGFTGAIMSPWLRVRFQSYTLNPRITPIYRSVVVRHRTRPRLSEVIQATIKCADGTLDREGVPMRPGSTMLDELRALSRPSQGPVTVTDLAGNKVIATIQPPVAETETWQDGVQFPEVAAQVRMALFYASSGTVWTNANE